MYSKILLLNFITASLMIMAVYCHPPSLKHGFHSVGVNDRRMIEALRNVEQQMNDRIDSPNLFRVETIDSSFIMEKVGFQASFLYGETECNKTDIDHIDSCKFTGHQIHCHAEIRKWYGKNKNTYELESFDCFQH
uniref:Uncharacterized protein LOC113796620 n=1 Tax=Dermatophagoides pteronyssinus TaxID=6956 RepID=A0A6P6YBR5_DERPT|nr:uncharacterized protein LOC113796620 [Dermatophagoides pteronyssinus]